MSVSSKLTVFALLTLSLLLIPACQSRPSLHGTTAIDRLATGDEWMNSDAPILVSRNDVLTMGTQAQIENHNNVYFCRFPQKRPAEFDVKLCNP